MTQTIPLKYWLVIIALGIGWGTSFVFNAVLLREIGPLTVSFGRSGLGAIGCWAYAIAMRKPLTMSWRLAGGMLFLGAFNFGIPFAVYPVSQQYVASGVAGIVNATTPVMVVIVSHFWSGGEKATLMKTAGVFAGLTGVALLALPAFGQGSEFLAILFLLLAPLCYAIAFNFARRYRDMDPTLVAAMALTGGTLFIAPVSLWVEGVPVIHSAQTWGALAVIGFVLTSAAFIVFYWLLPKIGPTNSSIITFIAPVSAVVLGSIVLGDALRVEHFVGMTGILAGLLLIDGRLFRRR
jgi:drug/metabolite transporter (DMT)-like permease